MGDLRSSELSLSERRNYRIVGLAEAWLLVPRRFRRELMAAPDLFDDEEIEDLCEASRGFSTSGGILFVTNRRLVFVICKWLRRKPSVWAISFRDISEAKIVMVGPDPNVF